MKKAILLLVLISLVYGEKINPCEDERFLIIKNKSLDDMSDREYEYFLRLDKACKEYNNTEGDILNTNNEPALETVPSENRTDVENEDYTVYLEALGCKLGQAIGKETGVYYYKDKTKNFDLWIKIEDHWSYLESIGYKKGKNINRDKGSLYIWKEGIWKKFTPQTQTSPQYQTQTSPQYQTQTSQEYFRGITDTGSQNNTAFYLRGGYDMVGNYLVEFDGEDNDEKVIHSAHIGADLILLKNGAIGLGFGSEYQFPRELDIDNAQGVFNFIPLYGLVMFSSPNTTQSYGIIRFGYSQFKGDEDYKGEFELEGGNYYSFALGSKFNNATIEIVWSLNQGKAIYSYGSEKYTAEIQYDKLSVGLSINLANLQN